MQHLDDAASLGSDEYGRECGHAQIPDDRTVSVEQDLARFSVIGPPGGRSLVLGRLCIEVEEAHSVDRPRENMEDREIGAALLA